MEDVLRFVIFMCVGAAVIMAGALWYSRSVWHASQDLCRDHAMEAIDISQGSGKGRHSVYLCRDAKGQLFSF